MAVSRRSVKRAHRLLVAQRARSEALTGFRRAAALRLQAARLYQLGAGVLGELSAEGRERWIRGRSPGGPTIERLSRLPDDEVRAEALVYRERFGVIVAPDGSEWTTPEQWHRRVRLGPELPPDFPRFIRRG